MHEYVPPPMPDRVNQPLNGTDSLPARIIDLRLWVTRLAKLKAESQSDTWEAGDNPHRIPGVIAERAKLYAMRASAEMGLIESDSTRKMWQQSELPGYLK